ncbi:MAG: metalloregulator ArsR/SmtB family transcription factor [Anaerolineae bacterium]|jgi:predicted DNA-binding transcriptional regulator|nr:metalloregulator ArsR/SmtB family transcription factor [Anaerolineae bacterium]
MTDKQELYFSMMLKALADDNRIQMLRLMSEREYTVTELAQIFGLSEPTISHHVSKLHAAGFLHRRVAANQRFYILNPRQIEILQQNLVFLTRPPENVQREKPDYAWIDSLDWSDADKKVLRDYTTNRKLTQLPTREKKWLVILRWIATKFEMGVLYTEKEVNQIITQIHPDYATIRRNLVEYNFMDREVGGKTYWLISKEG